MNSDRSPSFEYPDTAGYPDGKGFLDEGTAADEPDGSGPLDVDPAARPEK